MRLIFSLFKLPFWVFLIVAGGLFYLGELSYKDTLAKNQEMARALAGQPPETVGIGAFSRDQNIGLAREVSVQAVINPEYNYELTKRRKGSDKTRYMFVLFDADDAETSKQARGAMVLTEAQKDTFIDDYYLENSEIAFGEMGVVSVVTLNGMVERSPDLSSMVRDAFDEKNLTKSDDFIYIQPFLDGRAAGLTPTVTADEMRNVIRSVGLIVALIGVARFFYRRKKTSTPDTEPGQPEFSGNAYGFATPNAEPAALPETAHADAVAEQKGKKLFFYKALFFVALIGVALYLGFFAYAAVAAVIVLQLLVFRKVGRSVRGGMSKLRDKIPGRKTSDEAIMASVQAEANTLSTPQTFMEPTDMPDPEIDTDATPARKRGFALSLPTFTRKNDDQDMEFGPENDTGVSDAPRKGFKLPMPVLRSKSKDPVDAEPSVMAEMPADDDTPRRGFKLPGLGRKNNDAEEVAVARSDSCDETSKKGFKLSLPSLSRKGKKADDVAAAPARAPSLAAKKAAMQSEPLFRQDDTPEAPGLSDKLQLLMARFAPAEREPKAFAGRPDPFDRLAEDAQRLSAR